MSDRACRRPRTLSPLREHLRDTFWFAPTVGLVCSFVAWWGLSGLDTEIVAHLQDEGRFEEVRDLISFATDAKTIVTTISSAMMTFIGVVFSISLVAVQMAGGQLTPRVVRIFVRSRISKLTLTVFLATFAFSLGVLSSYESETDPRRITSVPLLQSLLTLLLVALSLLLFIGYVTATLRLMQVGPVVDHIAREAFRVLARVPSGPPARARDRAGHAPGVCRGPAGRACGAAGTGRAQAGCRAAGDPADRGLRGPRDTGARRARWGGAWGGAAPVRPQVHDLRRRRAHPSPGSDVRAAPALRHRPAGAVDGGQRSDHGRAVSGPDRAVPRSGGAPAPGCGAPPRPRG